MPNIKEAILRNCLIFTGDDGTQCTIEQGCLGDIIVRYPNGLSKRVQRASNGIDLLVPTPGGQEILIKI